MLLTIYDTDTGVILCTEIYTKGKNIEDIFTVVDEHAAGHAFDIKGRTLEVVVRL